jgi:integrase
MRDNGYASGTIGRTIATLKHAFFLDPDHNPAVTLRVPPDVQRSRFLSAEEAARLIAVLATDLNQTASHAILLMLLTGARRNEITQAQWTDVLWERKCLFVPISKSGKARMIVLNQRAMELLHSLVRQPGNPYIFPSPITGRPSPSLFFPWRRIRRRADLPGLRLHDLRHSFASFLVNKGVSLYVVQQLLGHLNIRTTQRYAHLAPELLERGANVMSEILAPPASAGSDRSDRG